MLLKQDVDYAIELLRGLERPDVVDELLADVQIRPQGGVAHLQDAATLELLGLDSERAEALREQLVALSWEGPVRAGALAALPRLERLVLDRAELKGRARLGALHSLLGDAVVGLEGLDLPQLRRLDLEHTKLADLGWLHAHPTLVEVRFRRCTLGSLDGLGDMPALRELALVRCQLPDELGLGDLPALRRLVLRTRVGLGWLPVLPALEQVVLDSPWIPDLGTLVKQPSLREVVVYRHGRVPIEELAAHGIRVVRATGHGF